MGLLALVVVVLAVIATTLTNLVMIRRYSAQISTIPENIPAMPMALVLGTSNWSLNGEPSVHFQGRIQAAARLYHAGKAQRLLLSGANPSIHYNEPQRMREALLAQGVPDEALLLDYAGRRTLDSVRRARDVFGAQRLIIVSQPYHLYRALFLADADGLTAYGLAASGPALQQRWRTEWREIFARVLAVLDIYLLDTKPHFPGNAAEH